MDGLFFYGKNQNQISRRSFPIHYVVIKKLFNFSLRYFAHLIQPKICCVFNIFAKLAMWAEYGLPKKKTLKQSCQLFFDVRVAVM